MKKVLESNKDYNERNLEIFILTECEVTSFEDFEKICQSQKQEICLKTLCKGKICKTCNKTLCNCCFNLSEHENHEIESVEEINICWCGNALEGYLGCKDHNSNIQLVQRQNNVKDRIRLLVLEIYNYCINLFIHFEDKKEVLTIVFRTLLKFLQFTKVLNTIHECLKEKEIIQFCSFYEELLKKQEHLTFMKYYSLVIELLFINPQYQTICFTLIEQNLLPIKLLHLFTAPFYLPPTSYLQCKLILKTLIQQLQFQQTVQSFQYQHKLIVRKCQSSFYSNIQLVKDIIHFIDDSLLFLYIEFIIKLNEMLSNNIIFDSPNISFLVLHQYVKIVVEISWKIIDQISNELLLKLIEIISFYLKEHLTLLYGNNQFYDILIGLLLIELDKRKIVNNIIQSILPECIQISFIRLSSYHQFIPQMDFNFENEIYPLRDNPILPYEYQTSISFAQSIGYQYPIAKISSIFELLNYELKTNGFKSFIKKFKEHHFDESFIYQLFLHCIIFEPNSTHFIQSSMDLVQLFTSPTQICHKDSITLLVQKHSLQLPLSIDIFNPLFLLTPQNDQKHIFHLYSTLCYAYDFPLLCGGAVDGWKKELLTDQEILINLSAIITRKNEYTILLIEFLWLRVNSNCIIQTHPVNKRIATILKIFSTQNILCSNTIWRLVSEYNQIDSNLYEEFYKIAISHSK
ncbi:hypothetical protein EHI8A_012610 [Entamoeba histolytica HM-1:IMSS-B]|uniref:UBR-type domain-containing protein n=5 Tax=Entamoeba histolytica TaxID=5759 RepID=C4LY74_ENTH1|nr:hypothetical protein EHI_051800 [Entamoeba histolytica HM-1:IMSS]EMD47428.1 Hypothetical protein EHI5A_032190 [Entamoeba histolytica KU27]EMH78044.1 hypothetical protein EHI8A_012610 [Entamoeba histolytica HM-1:IMSS-B]ENY62255.1 hypothetical protein EHI7A_016010 [Entamoeba histolytica HM-1:IMSS-A]GAT93748.1 hypothetical protein CL6EHI_051800 [Entamoeba histolytica]EAL48004.1 hypothetical protein EHI_051800 [Entamoeba histolytica HM-1:IMSS]|eukprot:XP_653390.1 hypothetical protein EHI_051800 [Entamoeba histolytica HM-1:IMSS]